MRAEVLALSAMLAVAGCARDGVTPDAPPAPLASSEAGEQGSTAAPGSPPAAIRLVKEHRADLHLWVSNQSFKDNPIVLTISIDGTEVVDQSFEVGSQHNWILFPVSLPPGQHVLNAASETGSEMRQRFTSHATEARYAAVDYWNYADKHGRHITWRIQSNRMAFD